LSRDSEAGRIRVPASLHKYLYGHSDPVNTIDPTGHNAIIEWLNLQFHRIISNSYVAAVGVPICAVAIKLENVVSPIMGLPQIPNLAGMTWDQMLYWCRFIILHHG
jgi:hypothetical protein